MARKAKTSATIDIPVLSEAATAAFNEYSRLSAVKSKADQRARKAKGDRDEQEKIVLSELGALVDGRLPDGKRGTLAMTADGRQVVIAREEQNRRAQQACVVGWWTMQEVQGA